MNCAHCGGYNPDSCIVCKRRCRIRVAVLTLPLLLLLTACDPPPPSQAPHDIWSLLSDWGLGIFILLFCLIQAWGSRLRRCPKCHTEVEEEDE